MPVLAADVGSVCGGSLVSETAGSLEAVAAIGGVAVGLDGMIFPRALDVGYCTIRALLQGDVPRTVIGGYCQVGPVPGAGRVLDKHSSHLWIFGVAWH